MGSGDRRKIQVEKTSDFLPAARKTVASKVAVKLLQGRYGSHFPQKGLPMIVTIADQDTPREDQNGQHSYTCCLMLPDSAPIQRKFIKTTNFFILAKAIMCMFADSADPRYGQ